MSFIFPQNDIYHIVLTGKSLTQKAFQPFSVSWDFRVDPISHGIVEDANHPSDIQVLVMAAGTVLIGLVLLGIFIKKEFFTFESAVK